MNDPIPNQPSDRGNFSAGADLRAGRRLISEWYKAIDRRRKLHGECRCGFCQLAEAERPADDPIASLDQLVLIERALQDFGESWAYLDMPSDVLDFAERLFCNVGRTDLAESLADHRSKQ